MVGRDLEVLYPKEYVALGDTRAASRTPDAITQAGRRVLDDVSLYVRAGEIVGVAGLMGAGRTQLLEAIFGVYPPHSLSGRSRSTGSRCYFASPAGRHRAWVWVWSQKIASCKAWCWSARSPRTPVSQRCASSLNRLPIVKAKAERQAVSQVVQDLNIKTPTIDTMVANLSGGNQQKVVIGKFLLTEIVLFLLDEPTRGIDVGAKAEIYHLVGQLAQHGIAFLLVSSEMPELLAVCDRIYVLCDGRLTGEFRRDAFDQEAIMEAATRFIDKGGAGKGPMPTPWE